MIDVKMMAKSKNAGGSSATPGSGAVTGGAMSEAAHAAVADRAKQADKAKNADTAGYADSSGKAAKADYATKAGDIDVDAETLSNHYLRKDAEDTAKKLIAFDEGLQVGGDGTLDVLGTSNFEDNESHHGEAGFYAGAYFYDDISANGCADFYGVTRSTRGIQSHDFLESTQRGYALAKTAEGKYRLSITDLEVWGKAVFQELEIRKLSHVGGNVYLSGAGGKIAYVKTLYGSGGVVTGYRCYLLADDGTTATQNLWQAGDQARCQTFRIQEGSHTGVANRSYWRLVSAVSSKPVAITEVQKIDGSTQTVTLYEGKLFHYIDLSATDCLAGSDIPEEGDTIVLDGCRDSAQADRQGVLLLESTGPDTPRIVAYKGIDSFSHEGREVFVLAPGGVTMLADSFSFVSGGSTMSMSQLLQTVTSIKSTVAEVSSTASTAFSTASAAQSSAEAAQRSASSAASSAASANQKAEAAQGTANTAQSTANTAQTSANAAQSTANTAQSTAKAAQNTANAAQNTANTANASANQANQAVDNLKSDLGTAQPSVLKNYTTTVEQTARKWSVRASEQMAGRRNLLWGSDFRRCDNLLYQSSANIGYATSATHGRDGHVAFKASAAGNGTSEFLGVFWREEGGCIRIKRNTRYTVSVWVKCDNTQAEIHSELYYRSAADSTTRITGPTPLSDQGGWHGVFKVAEAGTYGLYTFHFDTGADYDFLELALFLYSGADGKTAATAYFCMPMLEEGDTYGGWTLSERDGEYVGGNLLEDTRTLVPTSSSSNLQFANGVSQLAYEQAYAVAHAKAEESGLAEIMQFSNLFGGTLELAQGKEYVFSFLARGQGVLNAYLYHDSSPRIYVEGDDGKEYPTHYTDGCYNMQLTPGWRRRWVHWRIEGDGLPHHVLLRAINGAEVWVAQPKLEEGSAPTPYSESHADLIDRSTARQAGMEVSASDGVLLYGDKVRIKNGDATAALFEGGKISATFIDADRIDVKHLWAMSEDGKDKVGYFGNYEMEACRLEDGTFVPFFLGADTAGNAPTYITSKGQLVTTSARLGSWTLKDGGMYYDSGYEGQDPGMALYNDYLIFRGYNRVLNQSTMKWVSTRNRLVWIGEATPTEGKFPWKQSDIWIDDTAKTGENVSKVGLRVSVEGCDDSLQDSSSYYDGSLGSSDVYGNFAIYAEKGMHAGLRPAYRKIKTSKVTLTDMDFVVDIDGGESCRLYMPASPQRGQMYFINHTSNGALYINGNGHKVWVQAFGDSDELSFTTNGEMIIAIWNGAAWLLKWIRGNWN